MVMHSVLSNCWDLSILITYIQLYITQLHCAAQYYYFKYCWINLYLIECVFYGDFKYGINFENIWQKLEKFDCRLATLSI